MSDNNGTIFVLLFSLLTINICVRELRAWTTQTTSYPVTWDLGLTTQNMLFIKIFSLHIKRGTEQSLQSKQKV